MVDRFHLDIFQSERCLLRGQTVSVKLRLTTPGFALLKIGNDDTDAKVKIVKGTLHLIRVEVNPAFYPAQLKERTTDESDRKRAKAVCMG